MKPIFILNGPNLNQLGLRDNNIYGRLTLDEVEEYCLAKANEYKTLFGFSTIKIDFRQTNFEGELVEWIHEAGENSDGLIINPAAFSHYSIAVCDALQIISCPKIEVHLSNIYQREEFRRKSLTSSFVDVVIAGALHLGYGLAINTVIEFYNNQNDNSR